MIFLLIETGAMVTAYHSSIYLRKISAVSIFLGGLSKAKNETLQKKRETSVSGSGKLYPDELLFSGTDPDPYEAGKLCFI